MRAKSEQKVRKRGQKVSESSESRTADAGLRVFDLLERGVEALEHVQAHRVELRGVVQRDDLLSQAICQRRFRNHKQRQIDCELAYAAAGGLCPVVLRAVGVVLRCVKAAAEGSLADGLHAHVPLR